MSDALIFASTNPRYQLDMRTDCSIHENSKLKPEEKMFIAYRNCFWHSEQFLYTACSPHVLKKGELLTKIYLYKFQLKITTSLNSRENVLQCFSIVFPRIVYAYISMASVRKRMSFCFLDLFFQSEMWTMTILRLVLYALFSLTSVGIFTYISIAINRSWTFPEIRGMCWLDYGVSNLYLKHLISAAKPDPFFSGST